MKKSEIDKDLTQLIKSLIKVESKDRLMATIEVIASISSTLLDGVKDEYLEDARAKLWDGFAIAMLDSSRVRLEEIQSRDL